MDDDILDIAEAVRLPSVEPAVQVERRGAQDLVASFRGHELGLQLEDGACGFVEQGREFLGDLRTNGSQHHSILLRSFRVDAGGIQLDEESVRIREVRFVNGIAHLSRHDLEEARIHRWVGHGCMLL